MRRLLRGCAPLPSRECGSQAWLRLTITESTGKSPPYKPASDSLGMAPVSFFQRVLGHSQAREPLPRGGGRRPRVPSDHSAGRPLGRESCRRTSENGRGLQRELGERAPTLRSPTRARVPCAQGTGSLHRAGRLERVHGEARGWDSRGAPRPLGRRR